MLGIRPSAPTRPNDRYQCFINEDIFRIVLSFLPPPYLTGAPRLTCWRWAIWNERICSTIPDFPKAFNLRIRNLQAVYQTAQLINKIHHFGAPLIPAFFSKIIGDYLIRMAHPSTRTDQWRTLLIIHNLATGKSIDVSLDCIVQTFEPFEQARGKVSSSNPSQKFLLLANETTGPRILSLDSLMSSGSLYHPLRWNNLPKLGEVPLFREKKESVEEDDEEEEEEKVILATAPNIPSLDYALMENRLRRGHDYSPVIATHGSCIAVAYATKVLVWDANTWNAQMQPLAALPMGPNFTIDIKISKKSIVCTAPLLCKKWDRKKLDQPPTFEFRPSNIAQDVADSARISLKFAALDEIEHQIAFAFREPYPRMLDPHSIDRRISLEVGCVCDLKDPRIPPTWLSGEIAIEGERVFPLSTLAFQEGYLYGTISNQQLCVSRVWNTHSRDQFLVQTRNHFFPLQPCSYPSPLENDPEFPLTDPLPPLHFLQNLPDLMLFGQGGKLFSLRAVEELEGNEVLAAFTQRGDPIRLPEIQGKFLTDAKIYGRYLLLEGAQDVTHEQRLHSLFVMDLLPLPTTSTKA